GFLSLLLLVLVDEGGARWKDCRKCQEEPTNCRSVPFCDETSGCGDESSNTETNSKLMPTSLFNCGRVDSDAHYFFSTYHRPKATAAQSGKSAVAAKRAFSVRCIMRRLTA